MIDEASAELAFAELLDNVIEPATTRKAVIEIIPFVFFVWALYANLFFYCEHALHDSGFFN